MLLRFFDTLKAAGVPVTIRELLDLHEALGQNLVFADMERFYALTRVCMVKDERHYDRFDRAFSLYFSELESLDAVLEALIPDDWLRRQFLRDLSEEEKAKLESLGGLEQLLETLKKRLQEQKDQHHGGSKWIGTGGTSPFGNSGYHPAGIRMGGEGRQQRAVKVWEKRQFRNLDGDVEIGTRNMKMALRRLRQFARTGAAEELDLDDTIRSTARNAGSLDLKMVPERHNAVKVLLLLDVGGSMDPHVRSCEQLFSAARSEFKHLESYYFHNCVYEALWRDNTRRHHESLSTLELLHTYGSDYKLIFVGDAAMSPWELLQPGGSVEHWNEEAGTVWLQRLLERFPQAVWLNPVPQTHWDWTESTGLIERMMQGRMFGMTLDGLDAAIAELAN